MALNFCENCGGMVRNQQINKKQFYSFCDNCRNFKLITEEENFTTAISEKINKRGEKGDGISSGKNEFATYTNICKKCGHDKAQILDLGIFYSDEDNLIMLKCGKCGFAERIGKKTS